MHVYFMKGSHTAKNDRKKALDFLFVSDHK